MIRNDSTVALHRGWRGTYATATDANGNEIATDVPWPDGSWKGSGVSIDIRERHTWVGSLPMGQEDDSGLRYRRNRYDDPSSGQFTQQDVIGIAGGLNLYGYADGNPVNVIDPFGLCPEEADEDEICAD